MAKHTLSVDDENSITAYSNELRQRELSFFSRDAEVILPCKR
jgi:hypothetical protein